MVAGDGDNCGEANSLVEARQTMLMSWPRRRVVEVFPEQQIATVVGYWSFWRKEKKGKREKERRETEAGE